MHALRNMQVCDWLRHAQLFDEAEAQHALKVLLPRLDLFLCSSLFMVVASVGHG